MTDYQLLVLRMEGLEVLYSRVVGLMHPEYNFLHWVNSRFQNHILGFLPRFSSVAVLIDVGLTNMVSSDLCFPT
jgi:hypothetical protein